MTREELRALDSAEKRWPLTEYVINATHEEEFGIWKEIHETVRWEQCHGWIVTLGTVLIGKSRREQERMPVAVSVTWNLLDGHVVAFYEATSMVVDHRMVDQYIRGNCSKHTNATNFHHCAHELGLTLPTPKRSEVK